jgi:hypothetical protein
MFSDSLWRRNAATLLVGISALIAGGCATGNGGGGGGSPSLAATVAGLGNFSSGEQGAIYTITISNTGTAATNGTVTVADPPTGFTVTEIGGPLWTCTLATTTCTNSNSLAAGQSFTKITVTGNVTSPNGTPVTIPLTLSGGGATTVTVTPTPSVAVAAPTCSSLPLLNNENLLTGTYISILSGWKDGGGPSQAVAAFAANGAGVVTSGEMDSGTVVVDGAAQSAPTLKTVSSGCYQLGPDDRGLMIWNLTGGESITFAISVSIDQADNSNFLIEFDDANPGSSPGTRLAGRFYSQIGGPFALASFSGPLAFYTTGYSPNSGNTDYIRSGTVGRLDDSATGVVTNGALNAGITTAPGVQTNFDNQSFTGTFGPPDSLGRGILTLNFSSFGTLGAITYHFAYYVGDVNDLYMQSIDTPDNAGHSLQNSDVVTQVLSSYTPAALNGNAVLFMAGADLSTSHSFTVTAAGQVSGDGLGGASAKLDEVSDGSALCMGNTTISGGSFAVSPNGMGVLTIGPGACAKAFSIVMFNQNSGYMLEGTAASPGSHVLTGSLRPQRAPASGFGDGTFSGVYVFGVHNQASAKSVFEVGSVMTPTPQTSPPGSSGMIDDTSGVGCNTGCLFSNQAVSATYNVDANGRITISMPGLTGGPSVGWFVNNGKRFIAISDTNDANGTILNAND